MKHVVLGGSFCVCMMGAAGITTNRPDWLREQLKNSKTTP